MSWYQPSRLQTLTYALVNTWTINNCKNYGCNKKVLVSWGHWTHVTRVARDMCCITTRMSLILIVDVWVDCMFNILLGCLSNVIPDVIEPSVWCPLILVKSRRRPYAKVCRRPTYPNWAPKVWGGVSGVCQKQVIWFIFIIATDGNRGF